MINYYCRHNLHFLPTTIMIIKKINSLKLLQTVLFFSNSCTRKKKLYVKAYLLRNLQKILCLASLLIIIVISTFYASDYIR